MNENERYRIEETFFRATKHAHVLESYDQMTGYFIETNFTLNFSTSITRETMILVVFLICILGNQNSTVSIVTDYGLAG